MPSLRQVCAAASGGALLTLTACSPPPIDIVAVSDGARTTLRLSQDWGFVLTRRRAPCVASVRLYREAAEPGQAVREIGATGAVQCVRDVATVTIGETPPGFTAGSAAAAPGPGRYVVEVSGIGTDVATVILR